MQCPTVHDGLTFRCTLRGFVHAPSSVGLKKRSAVLFQQFIFSIRDRRSLLLQHPALAPVASRITSPSSFAGRRISGPRKASLSDCCRSHRKDIVRLPLVMETVLGNLDDDGVMTAHQRRRLSSLWKEVAQRLPAPADGLPIASSAGDLSRILRRQRRDLAHPAIDLYPIKLLRGP